MLVHRRVEIGRLRAPVDRLPSSPWAWARIAGGSEPLDLDLIGPVRVLRREQLVLERVQLGDFRLRAGNIAGTASPSARANEIMASAHGKRSSGKPIAGVGERGRRRPVAPLEREARRDRRDGVGGRQVRRRRSACTPAARRTASPFVLRRLQIGVVEVIHRVDGLAVKRPARGSSAYRRARRHERRGSSRSSAATVRAG